MRKPSFLRTEKSPEGGTAALASPRRDVAQGEARTALPASLLQRARSAPHTLTPADVLRLQRAVGNRQVQRLLAPGRASGARPPAALSRSRPAGPSLQRVIVDFITGPDGGLVGVDNGLSPVGHHPQFGPFSPFVFVWDLQGQPSFSPPQTGFRTQHTTPPQPQTSFFQPQGGHSGYGQPHPQQPPPTNFGFGTTFTPSSGPFGQNSPFGSSRTQPPPVYPPPQLGTSSVPYLPQQQNSFGTGFQDFGPTTTTSSTPDVGSYGTDVGLPPPFSDLDLTSLLVDRDDLFDPFGGWSDERGGFDQGSRVPDTSQSPPDGGLELEPLLDLPPELLQDEEFQRLLESIPWSLDDTSGDSSVQQTPSVDFFQDQSGGPQQTSGHPPQHTSGGFFQPQLVSPSPSPFGIPWQPFGLGSSSHQGPPPLPFPFFTGPQFLPPTSLGFPFTPPLGQTPVPVTNTEQSHPLFVFGTAPTNNTTTSGSGLGTSTDQKKRRKHTLTDQNPPDPKRKRRSRTTTPRQKKTSPGGSTSKSSKKKPVDPKFLDEWGQLGHDGFYDQLAADLRVARDRGHNDHDATVAKLDRLIAFYKDGNFPGNKGVIDGFVRVGAKKRPGMVSGAGLDELFKTEKTMDFVELSYKPKEGTLPTSLYHTKSGFREFDWVDAQRFIRVSTELVIWTKARVGVVSGHTGTFQRKFKSKWVTEKQAKMHEVRQEAIERRHTPAHAVLQALGTHLEITANVDELNDDIYKRSSDVLLVNGAKLDEAHGQVKDAVARLRDRIKSYIEIVTAHATENPTTVPLSPMGPTDESGDYSPPSPYSGLSLTPLEEEPQGSDPLPDLATQLLVDWQAMNLALDKLGVLHPEIPLDPNSKRGKKKKGSDDDEEV